MLGRVGKEWPRPPQWRAQTERLSLPHPTNIFMPTSTGGKSHDTSTTAANRRRDSPLLKEIDRARR